MFVHKTIEIHLQDYYIFIQYEPTNYMFHYSDVHNNDFDTQFVHNHSAVSKCNLQYYIMINNQYFVL